MGKTVDHTGEIIGKLTVVERLGKNIKTGRRECYYRFKCICGNYTIDTYSNVKNGTKNSCGCERMELISNLNKKHGQKNTRLYRIWLNMKNRCNNPNYKQFDRYGGRGIKVCDLWSDDFMEFYNWAINNGYDESLTIDRIDNDKGYFPDNCRWVTRAENNRNRGKRRWQKRPKEIKIKEV